MASRLSIELIGVLVLLACACVAVEAQNLEEKLAAHISEKRDCYSEQLTEIPVYVSADLESVSSSVFKIEIQDGETITMAGLSTTTLIGWIPMLQIPGEVTVRVLKDNLPATEWSKIYIENSFQAMTIGLHDAPRLADDFVRAVGLNDLWGTYIYGVAGESVSHLRDFFEPTCARLAEAGFEDVYVTSFLEWRSILPVPEMRLSLPSGIGGISEEEMQALASTAHSFGLRLHVMYNAVSHLPDSSHLSSGRCTRSWLQQLFDSYGAIMLREAEKAEASSVDSLVLNWQDAWVNCGSHTQLWDELWSHLAESVREVFSGTLEFNVANTQDLYDSARLEKTAQAVDSMLVTQWSGHLQWWIGEHWPHSPCSVGAAEAALRDWLRVVGDFKRAVKAPVTLLLSFLSSDTYMQDGWCDAIMARCGRAQPDFGVQADLYEILLRLSVETDTLDGILSYKYHWDDPFGPDLPMDALSRLDLSDSIRNKPAEAVIKRWFRGEAGPSMAISEDSSESMCRIWCAPCMRGPTSQVGPDPRDYDESPYALPIDSQVDCDLEIDSFEGSGADTFPDWQIDFDSAEMHSPGVDSLSTCVISRETQDQFGGYVLAEYGHSSWMKLRYWGSPSIDASGYEGIQMTMWAEDSKIVSVELGMVPPAAGWKSGRIDEVWITKQPTVYRFPFAEFETDRAEDSERFISYLRNLIAVAVFFPRGSGFVAIDDICFYTASPE